MDMTYPMSKTLHKISDGTETIRYKPAALSLFLLLGLLQLNCLQAADDIYQGSAVVSDQSPAELEKGMRGALRLVLGKVSGLSDFSDYPGVDEALTEARKMVMAFYYQNHPVLLPDGNFREESRLVANFSPRAVDQLQADLQLPRWKPDRRPLNAWPIVDSGQQRTIMPIELQYAWEGMANLARNRGMPIRWPEADENGEYAVDVQLLWGGYNEELREQGPGDQGPGAQDPGAQGPGETLVITALQDGPEWNVRMNMEYEGLRWSERFRGPDLETVLAQGLNLAIDQVVAASSIAAADTGDWHVDITVTHLTNAQDYARCLSYLQGLNVVESVAVKMAQAGQVEFSLSLNAAPSYLKQYFLTGKTLQATAFEGEYQLQP